MTGDPFNIRKALLELAVTVLVVAFCLHWAALLIAEVWPWLLGISCVALVLAIGWRVLLGRRNRW